MSPVPLLFRTYILSALAFICIFEIVVGGALLLLGFRLPTQAQGVSLEAGKDFTLWLGMTFLIIGAVVLILLFRLVSGRGDSTPPLPNSGGTPLWSVVLLSLGLIALFVSLPLVPFGVESYRLLESWGTWESHTGPSGALASVVAAFILMAPLFITAATLSISGGSLLVCGLRKVEPANLLRAILVSGLISFSLVVASYCSLDLMLEITRPVNALLSQHPSAELADLRRWLDAYNTLLPSIFRNVFLVFLAWSAATGAVYWRTRTSAKLASIPFSPAAEDLSSDSEGRFSLPERLTSRQATVLLPSEWQFPTYLIKGSEIRAPAHYPDAKTVFRLQRRLIAFKPTIIINNEGRTVVTVTARHYYSSTYDVVDTISGRHLGILDRWIIKDNHSQDLGFVKELNVTSGFAKYAVWIGGTVAANFTCHRGFLGNELEADFSPDTSGCFDRRLGVALAVVLSVGAASRMNLVAG